MEINTIPKAFQTKLRLSIISALLSGELSFKELKKVTNSTDGNLGAQLLKLEDMGYITSKKEFISRKPRTSYRLTELGINSFKEYVNMLETLLKNSRLPH